MLNIQLPVVSSLERQLAGKQFLVDNGQAVLIAESADAAPQDFRRRVPRRHTACSVSVRWRNRAVPLFLRETIDQPKIRHLDVAAHQKQVLRLDIEMLQFMLEIHEVESFGGLGQISQQVRVRQARQTAPLAIHQQIGHAAVGQFHHDHQNAALHFGPFDRQNERMPDVRD